MEKAARDPVQARQVEQFSVLDLRVALAHRLPRAPRHAQGVGAGPCAPGEPLPRAGIRREQHPPGPRLVQPREGAGRQGRAERHARQPDETMVIGEDHG